MVKETKDPKPKGPETKDPGARDPGNATGPVPVPCPPTYPGPRLLLVQHGPGGVTISDASAMRAGFTHFNDPVVGQTEKAAFMNLVNHLVGVDQIAVLEQDQLMGVMRQLDIGFPEVIEFLRMDFLPYKAQRRAVAEQNKQAAESETTGCDGPELKTVE